MTRDYPIAQYSAAWLPCLQVQRELRAAKAEQQRLRDELDSRESDVHALKKELDMLRANRAGHSPKVEEDDDEDSWLVSAKFGDELVP